MKKSLVKHFLHLQQLGLSLLLVVFVSGIVTGTARAETCPTGTTALDCQALLNDWVDWVPNQCNQSVAEFGSLNGMTLPASSGKTGIEAPINADGQVADPNPNPDNGKFVTFFKYAKLGLPYRNYYITMRWNYTQWNWDGTNVGLDQAQFLNMSTNPTPRLVQVKNKSNGKSIIAAALESGPAPWTGVDTAPNNVAKEGWHNPQTGTPLPYTGRVSGLPQTAIDALGAHMGMADGSGDDLGSSWAEDQNATPGPISKASPSSSSSPSCVTTSGLGNTVFISQRDPKWAGQVICWSSGCGAVHDEGCWATSVAMIISTFDGKNWPNVITPMQTEGNGTPYEDWTSSGLNAVTYFGHDRTYFNLALDAVRKGALVLVHASGAGPDGGPFYNTPTHYEVLRSVSPDGKSASLNDPWDLPDPNNPAQPDPNGHSLKTWPLDRDVFPYVLDFTIVTKPGIGG